MTNKTKNNKPRTPRRARRPQNPIRRPRRRGNATMVGASDSRYLRFLTDPLYASTLPQPREVYAENLQPGYSRTDVSYTAVSGTWVLVILHPKLSSPGKYKIMANGLVTNGTWASMTTIGPGTTTPLSTQVASDNVKSTCLTATYLGPPLYAEGEVLFGHIPSDSVEGMAGMNYSGWKALSGITAIPMSHLLGKTLKVFGRKYSSAADEFSADEYVTDYMCPVIAYFTGGATNQTLNIRLEAAFDCCPVLGGVAFSVLTQPANNAPEISAFERARQRLTNIGSEVLSEGFDVAGRMIEQAAFGVGAGASLGMGIAAQRRLRIGL